MDKITTTIKREWLKKIANRTKRVPRTQTLLGKTPLSSSSALLAPSDKWAAAERTRNHRSGNEGQEDSRSRQFELVLGKIVELKHWSVRSGGPTT
jgi:hypothetical protein